MLQNIQECSKVFQNTPKTFLFPHKTHSKGGFLQKHVNRPSLKINSKSSPGQALTGEASKVVDTLAELSAIVVLGLTALVEVLDSRDRVERAGDVEVPVPNVVRTCLDNSGQLSFVFLLGLLYVVCFLTV